MSVVFFDWSTDHVVNSRVSIQSSCTTELHIRFSSLGIPECDHADLKVYFHSDHASIKSILEKRIIHVYPVLA